MPVVDRICGDKAVIENDDGSGRTVISRKLVDSNVREGDVVVLVEGIYQTDTEKTEKRRNSNYRLSESLWDD